VALSGIISLTARAAAADQGIARSQGGGLLRGRGRGPPEASLSIRRAGRRLSAHPHWATRLLRLGR